jgi:hypothetical protein
VSVRKCLSVKRRTKEIIAVLVSTLCSKPLLFTGGVWKRGGRWNGNIEVDRKEIDSENAKWIFLDYGILCYVDMYVVKKCSR